MTTKLYLIKDTLANTVFGGLIRVSNDEVARRNFYDALQAKDSPLNAHPADYNLLCVGTMDETTGIINPQDIPNIVATGKDWVDANKEA